MKQGIVVKKHRHYAIVLSGEGGYEKINIKPGLTIGQKIYYLKEDEYHMNKNMYKWGSLAAAFLLVVTLSLVLGNWDTQASTYAIVTVDINPSVQISVDENNKVLNVETLNEDAKQVVNEDMVGKDLQEVLDMILAFASEKGYLVEEGDILISSVIVGEPKDQEEVVVETAVENAPSEESVEVADATSETNAEVTSETTEETTDEVTEGTTVDPELLAEADIFDDVEQVIAAFIAKQTDKYNFLYVQGTETDLNTAKSQGLSLGKFEILKFLDPDITQEMIKGMKVAAIAERKEIKALQKQERKEIKFFGQENEQEVQDVEDTEPVQGEKVVMEEDVDSLTSATVTSGDDQDKDAQDKASKGKDKSKNVDKDRNKEIKSEDADEDSTDAAQVIEDDDRDEEEDQDKKEDKDQKNSEKGASDKDSEKEDKGNNGNQNNGNKGNKHN